MANPEWDNDKPQPEGKVDTSERGAKLDNRPDTSTEAVERIVGIMVASSFCPVDWSERLLALAKERDELERDMAEAMNEHWGIVASRDAAIERAEEAERDLVEAERLLDKEVFSGRALVKTLRQRVKELEEAAKALSDKGRAMPRVMRTAVQALNVCYRMGTLPPETLHKRLEAAKEALNERR